MRSAQRSRIKSAALALFAASEMKPGGILELSEETEEITEEDPCCVSALLGCLSNAPVSYCGVYSPRDCFHCRIAFSFDFHYVACLLWGGKGRGGILIAARLSPQWSFFQVLLALRASQQLGEVSVLLLGRSGRFYVACSIGSTSIWLQL